MKINRENYELYFLDHLEGRLLEGMEGELRAFLDGNPDLREEYDLLKQTYLAADEGVTLIDKENLHRTFVPVADITDDNFDEKVIDLMEEEDDQLRADVDRFLEANPRFRKEHQWLLHTRLTPEMGIIYRDKQKLKKRAGIMLRMPSGLLAATVAAILLILLGLPFLLRETTVSTRVEPVPIMTPLAADIAVDIDKGHNAILIDPAGSPGSASAIQVTAEVTATIEREPVIPSMPTYAANSMTSRGFDDPTSGMVLTARNEFITGPVEESNRSLFGRVLAGLFTRAAETVVPEASREESRDRFSFWSLARAGIEGYNMMADRQVDLVTSEDGEGKVVAYTLLESDEVLLTRRTPNAE